MKDQGKVVQPADLALPKSFSTSVLFRNVQIPLPEDDRTVPFVAMPLLG
jgi:hypothetical protein